MAIPLKIVSGTPQQFGSSDTVQADGIVPRSGTTLGIGSDAATTVINMNGVSVTTINVGNSSTQVNIPGTMTVTTMATFDGDTEIGDNIADTLTVVAGIADDLTFRREDNHIIRVQDSSTANTAGGNLLILAATGTGSGDGGGITLTGGGTTSGVPGGIVVESARTVATQGAAFTITQDGTSAGILVGTVDPSAGGGVVAPEGSLFLRDAGASGSLYVKTGAAATAWSAVGTGGSDTLQQAYVAGNTISVTSGEGTISFSNTTDATDVLTVSRTFAGAGEAIAVTMGPGGESVTGRGVEIVSGTGASGTALFVDNQGTGNALQIQDGSVDRAVISATGGIDLTAAVASSFTTAAGSLTLTAAAASVWSTQAGSLTVNGGGGLTLQSASATIVDLTAAGAIDVTPVAGEDITVTASTSSNIIVTLETGDFTLTTAASGGGGNIELSTTTISGPGGDILVTASTTGSGNAGDVIVSTVGDTGRAGRIRLLSTASTDSSFTGDIDLSTHATGSRTGTGDAITNISGSTFELDDSAATFTADDIGRRLNIAGATSPGNNGDFIITNVTSGTTLEYTNANGNTEAYGGTWTIYGTSGAVNICAGIAVPILPAAGSITMQTSAGNLTVGTRSSFSYPGQAGDVELSSIAVNSPNLAGDVLIGSTGTSGGTAGGVAIYAGSGVTAPISGQVTITGTTSVEVTADGAFTDLTFEARSAPITLNESGQESLSGFFTATSIVGALNELAGGGTAASEVVQTGFDTTTNSLGNGDLGYLTTTANRVQKAIATSVAAATVIGANEGVAGSMTTHGTIGAQNVESGITVTAGDRLFVSATEAGTVTNVAPTTAGQVVAQVGVARAGNGGAGNDVSMLLLVATPILL